ncbi:ecotropic viral integration site 5 ortholog-like isoform X1 [Anthonomus grandis grandis]|uniref:ecotropic viral integration site 5 ortholog-like isoform X1 n=1 Tax=Anthonomus grandis grandis TaxID=2921223 RepID=UPI00216517AE|nr:ecotropic viral integration site 5 ortholog-like isoform X1 [Anthonomus grandis grandis]XP_050302259.1 ecotropic viral integration site 5 ortholog-like isoform X1 [Anthonomus grandis grandis]
MLKFAENAYLSILEQKQEEKEELENARKMQEELKNRLKRLEEENKNLKEKCMENEIGILDKKNELNTLLETLQKERRATLEEYQRLQICKEQIDSLNAYIDELKPIKEQLNFKKSVTECLHDLLIKTKLRIAESDEVLQELHEYFTQLDYDIEKTREVHKRGLGHWQDEFLAARLREADIILEFDKLKREVAILKSELQEKKVIRDAKDLHKRRGKNAPSKDLSGKNDKFIEAILQEEEAVIANTVELQNEVDFLRHQLKKLEDQKQDCTNKIRSNEDVKMNLNQIRRSIWLREFQTRQKIDNLKEKYHKLSKKKSEELEKIKRNIEEKDLAIKEMEQKINYMQKQNNCEEEEQKSLSEKDLVEQLEEEKDNLEKEILQLKEEEM